MSTYRTQTPIEVQAAVLDASGYREMSRVGAQHPEREVGDVSVEAGRAKGQLGWYRFAAHLFAGNSVLDAGCGLGYGLAELRRTTSAVGQDLDPRLQREEILIKPIEAFPTDSYDFVVSIDVVEHVPDDASFVRELARVARRGIFLTTPLAFYKRPLWPYHIREYRANEFIKLLSPHGELTYFTGTQSGEIITKIIPAYFWIIDRLINSPLANVPFRVAQKAFPRSLRYNGHQGALVELSKGERRRC